MIKNCAIVCEYNPFHTGHEYQLDRVRDFGVQNIFCIMSGSFVQSASPAFCYKALRSECAVLGGADAVIELPAVYATASAQFFAEGAMKIISGIKNITHIAMSTVAKSDTVLAIADLKIKRAELFSKTLRNELDTGKSYNAACAAALGHIYTQYHPDADSIDRVFSDPNSILAIEYITALDKLAANIEPIIIKRYGAEYNDRTTDNRHISATAIRASELDKVKPFIPYKFDEIKDFRIRHAADLSMFYGMIVYALKKSHISDLARLRDCSEGMEFLLKNISAYSNFDDYMCALTTKRYGKKRLSRLFLDLLLDIDKQTMNKRFCTRLLACRKNFDFSLLPDCVKTNNRDIRQYADNDTEVKSVLKIDENATALFNTLCSVNGDYYNYSLVKV